MNDDLKRAAQQFSQVAAGVAAPVVSAGAPADLANFGKAMFLDPVVKAATAGSAAVAGIGADRDKEARAAAEKAAADAADPDKYTKVRKADGGFAFFDPTGKEVDISTYAMKTGRRRADIVADSENPIDLAYINDFDNMNKLAQAFYNNDTDTIKAYQDQNKSLRGLKSAQDVMGLINKKYPHMYGTGKYQDTLKNRNMSIFSNNPNYIGGSAPSATKGGWSPS